MENDADKEVKADELETVGLALGDGVWEQKDGEPASYMPSPFIVNIHISV